MFLALAVQIAAIGALLDQPILIVGAMVLGPDISVTTGPAAGNIAVAIALAHWDEVGASLVQLGVNLAGLVVAGVGTLLVQQVLWSRFDLRLMAPNILKGSGERATIDR